MNACFDAADQRAYQNRISNNDIRAAQGAMAEDRITDELVLLFHAGLNGNRSVRMPYARVLTLGGDLTAGSMSFTTALFDTLDAAPIAEQFMAALAATQCPLFADVKNAMARRYAEDHARDLAEIEAEDE